MKHIKPAQSDGRGSQDDLIRVMETYGLTLPRNAQEWRVSRDAHGERIKGELVGILVGQVEVLCTDGLLAYFLLGNGETVIYGHLANLKVNKPERSSGKQGRSTGAPKQRKGVKLALDFLDEQISKL